MVKYCILWSKFDDNS